MTLEIAPAADRRLVGRPVRRLEDERLLRGEGRFVDDIDLPGMVHVAFARSLESHARLTRVDVEHARSARGVVAVYTAAELAGHLHALPVNNPAGGEVDESYAHPILAAGEVRYVGQPIAAIVAESRALAEDAAELVEIEYDPLPPVVDPRSSEEVLFRWSHTGGDVDAAFAACERVVRGSFHFPRLVAAPIEPRGAVAAYDGDSDVLTVWSSAQGAHMQLASLSHVLQRPAAKVRLIVADTGGSFGSKGAIGGEHGVVAFAAIALARPVKWAEDRLENFIAAYQGRGMDVEAELALTDGGRMLGIRAVIYPDLGAYVLTPITSHTAAMLITGCYAIPAAAVRIDGRATNKVPLGSYRGAGRPEAAYVIEQMVELAARELGLDSIELRRRNLIRAFPHQTAMGYTYDSGDYERCMDLALELIEPDRSSDEQREVAAGIALYVERSGGLWETAAVRIDRDGTVRVASGSAPHGQGHHTTFAQIVADELGVDPGAVAFEFGDSAAIAEGVGTFGSRSAVMAGSAVLAAVREVTEKARLVAARLLDVPEDEVVWADLEFSVAGSAVSLADVAAAARKGELEATAKFSTGFSFAAGAYAAVVEIERATGFLRVLRMVAVDDAGRIINPLLAEGQVIGGIVQGLGQVLTEELVHDEYAQPRSATFLDYRLLTAAETPPIESRFVEVPSPSNPLGAKGIGEGGAIGAPPAVANAVLAALDGRLLDPPFTPEKLWRALHAR